MNPTDEVGGLFILSLHGDGDDAETNPTDEVGGLFILDLSVERQNKLVR